MEHLKKRIFCNKQMFLFSLLGGILLSASIVIGGKIDRNNWCFIRFKSSDIVVFIWSIFLITFISYIGFHILSKYGNREKKVETFVVSKWIKKSVLIFLCWIPYFLMFYPGNMSVDSYSSIQQILGEKGLNNHHPIMFTLLVGIFVRIGMMIGDLEIGIAMYSIFQMSVLALSFGGVVEWFSTRGSRKAVILSSIFFSLNPLIAIYSMTMWKDILFSNWILLLVVFLYDLLSKKKEEICKGYVRAVLAALGILISFGRNNGIYIMIFVYIMLFLYYREFWKKTILVFSITIIGVMFIQGPVYQKLGIEKGHLAESLAVPLQQIAYTVKNGGNITEEQADFLEKIIPLEKMKEVYLPYSANGVKFDDEFNNEFLEKNVGEFLTTWAEMLPKNFKNYVKAYLMHTWGYWHIGTNDWRCVYGLVDSPGIEQTNYLQKITGINFIEKIRNIVEYKINEIPIINLLYSIAFSVWVVIFTGLAFVTCKREKYILCLLPLLINWLTIMIASPIFCEFRYMFSFHIVLPVMFFFVFSVIHREIDDNLS